MAAAKGNQTLGSLGFLHHRSPSIPAHIAHHLAMMVVLPTMFWASPAWWTGTPMVTAPLSTTYNAIARWITGLPLNTRISNLLTLAQLPPLKAYLDYLSLQYTIRLHFLPSHHVLDPPRATPKISPSLPGLHHQYNLSKQLVMGKLENRTSISSAEGVPITPSPNPDKTTRPQKLHEQWLESQENHTIIIYTDGSKLDNGSTGCGWAIYHCGDQHLYRLGEGSCHLGSQAKVYDAELHVVQEAVSTLLTTTAPRGTVIICIDNQAAMATLNFNKHNHEYARRALDSIEDLRTLGWQISITWCPSHCNIRGNERADTLAKQGAGRSVLYRFALTTKTWILMQARAQLMEPWKTQLPLSTPSFTFPKHLPEVEWADTRALWRVFLLEYMDR